MIASGGCAAGDVRGFREPSAPPARGTAAQPRRASLRRPPGRATPHDLGYLGYRADSPSVRTPAPNEALARQPQGLGPRAARPRVGPRCDPGGRRSARRGAARGRRGLPRDRGAVVRGDHRRVGRLRRHPEDPDRAAQQQPLDPRRGANPGPAVRGPDRRSRRGAGRRLGTGQGDQGARYAGPAQSGDGVRPRAPELRSAARGRARGVRPRLVLHPAGGAHRPGVPPPARQSLGAQSPGPRPPNLQPRA